MELSQRLTKIAAEFGLHGSADAQLAIAACVLLDRNNEIALDGRDLAGTMTRLATNVSAVPRWKKYSVDLAAVKAAAVEGAMAKVPLMTTGAGITVIHDAIIKPAASFVGAAAAAVVVNVYVGKTGAISTILGQQVGYGDGAGIEADAGYIQSAYSQLFDTDKVAKNVAFFAAPTEIDLFVELTVDPGPAVAADYDALTAGAVDVWMLESVLP